MFPTSCKIRLVNLVRAFGSNKCIFKSCLGELFEYSFEFVLMKGPNVFNFQLFSPVVWRKLKASYPEKVPLE